MADDLDEALDGELDDDAVRRLFLTEAGPPVDVEADLRGVLERAGRQRMRRMLVPIVVGVASAAALVTVVLVRVGSDRAELVPAGPGRDLPAATSAPGSPASPASSLSSPSPSSAVSTTPAPAASPPASTAPAPTTPALTAPEPTASPVVPSSGAPPPQTQTYSCAGGSVTVRWTSAALDLQSVSATAGWTIEDQQARSDRVEVRFVTSEEQRSELRLRLRDGTPVLECRD